MAGGAYVPLDPGYPAAQVKHIMEDAELKVLLVKDEDTFAQHRDVVKWPVLSVTNILDDALLPEQSAVGWCAPAPNTSCYIMYTSGSTGKPKGVVLEHANISSFIQHGALCAFKGLGPGSRFLLSSPMTFDMSCGIQFSTFSLGATLILAPKYALLDELELLINRAEVS
ncbi:MAG: AMP-binding protein [Gammaproteobacteria bacterium]|nr:AMP-binding protein [Gammaproteobacteria bacterium]